MKIKHLMVEGYCDGNKSQDMLPCRNTYKMGMDCFECPKFSYTFCPNEIAISNEEGIVEHWIGFGGDMEPDEREKRNESIALWNQICREKINEAYDEYMEFGGTTK